MSRRTRTLPLALLVAITAALFAISLPAAATSAPPGCANRTNTTYQTLLACVTLDGVRAHQQALQAIADANDADPFHPGSRAAGTAGYEASVDYVAGQLRDAGYDVTLQDFEFEFTFAELQQLTPVSADYDTIDAVGASAGEVTGTVVPVDINLVLPRANTSACEAADFAGLDFTGPADIALVQRGTCAFGAKAVNA